MMMTASYLKVNHKGFKKQACKILKCEQKPLALNGN